MINKINVYTCAACGGKIVTEDIVEGVTPYMLACKATVGCGGLMRSSFYSVDQTLKAGWEWYKPKSLHKYPPDVKSHIRAGGLMLRKKELQVHIMPDPISGVEKRATWIAELRDREPCDHPGCLSHVTHPCEGCGRVAGHR